MAGSVIQATGRTDFEDDPRIGNQSEARTSLRPETAFRGSALYLRTRALLFSGAGWTRFLRGQTKVQPAKFRTVWGSNPGCGVRIELA